MRISKRIKGSLASYTEYLSNVPQDRIFIKKWSNINHVEDNIHEIEFILQVEVSIYYPYPW